MTSTFIRIVREPRQRRPGEYYGYSCDRMSKVHILRVFGKETYNSFREHLKEDNTVLLMNHSFKAGEVPELTLNSHSKVFKVGKSQSIGMDEAKVKQFFNPDTVTLSEVEASPEKKRVTVEGVIEKVYDTENSRPGAQRPWKRKDVAIFEPRSHKRMKIKLWGDETDKINQEHEDSNIKLTSGAVEKYEGRTSINCIDVTQITITKPQVQSDDIAEGDVQETETILGIDEQEKFVHLATANKTITVPIDVFEPIAEEFADKLPCTVKLMYSNKTVTQIAFAM